MKHLRVHVDAREDVSSVVPLDGSVVLAYDSGSPASVVYGTHCALDGASMRRMLLPHTGIDASYALAARLDAQRVALVVDDDASGFCFMHEFLVDAGKQNAQHTRTLRISAADKLVTAVSATPLGADAGAVLVALEDDFVVLDAQTCQLRYAGNAGCELTHAAWLPRDAFACAGGTALFFCTDTSVHAVRDAAHGDITALAHVGSFSDALALGARDCTLALYDVGRQTRECVHGMRRTDGNYVTCIAGIPAQGPHSALLTGTHTGALLAWDPRSPHQYGISKCIGRRRSVAVTNVCFTTPTVLVYTTRGRDMGALDVRMPGKELWAAMDALDADVHSK